MAGSRGYVVKSVKAARNYFLWPRMEECRSVLRRQCSHDEGGVTPMPLL